jgi:hypothetical protein
MAPELAPSRIVKASGGAMRVDKDRLMKARGIVYVATAALIAVAYLISRMHGA